jgi:hypothetical protein
MNDVDLHNTLKELSEERPIFHSEADFKFALAWKIKEKVSPEKIIIEYPVNIENKRIYIDIYFKKDNNEYFLELKYKTKKYEVDYEDMKYNLKNHGAPDIARYSYLKDIERLEKLLDINSKFIGYTILLTNDNLLWEKSSKKNNDYQYQIYNGYRLNYKQKHDKKIHLKSNSKRIEGPIKLRFPYNFNWYNYTDGFNYLLNKISFSSNVNTKKHIIDDKEVTIFRYMTYEKFINIINNDHILFSKINNYWGSNYDIFSDESEGKVFLKDIIPCFLKSDVFNNYILFTTRFYNFWMTKINTKFVPIKTYNDSYKKKDYESLYELKEELDRYYKIQQIKEKEEKINLKQNSILKNEYKEFIHFLENRINITELNILYNKFLVDDYFKNYYLQSWNISSHDDLTMWKSYSNIYSGVAFKTTDLKIKKYLEKYLKPHDNGMEEIMAKYNFYLNKVSYDFKYFVNKKRKIDFLFFKNNFFRNEREFRIVFEISSLDLYNIFLKKSLFDLEDNVLKLNLFSIDEFIDEIILSPKIEKWIEKDIRKIIKDKNINIKISKSSYN